MNDAVSIYLHGLADAQRAFCVRYNEQHRRPTTPVGDYFYDYLTPDPARHVEKTIRRWMAGERLELDEDTSPRDLDGADIMLAHMSNPDHSGCEAQTFVLALALPSMIERVVGLESADSLELTAHVATFYNCRETGLVYTITQPDGTARSFSVYEHRNSDSIIINGCTDWDGQRLPYAADSKNGFFAELACGSYEQAADALTFYLVEAARGELADDATLVATAEHLDWNAIIAERISGYGDWLEQRGVKPANRLRGSQAKTRR
jgi:hypothetical protein